jgi:NTE family protein
MTVGVVLGSGGLVGPTFHLAALSHLRDAGRLDPDNIDVIVGTSGGSIVASLLASGVPFDSLLAAFHVDQHAAEPIEPIEPSDANDAHDANDQRRADLDRAVECLLSLPALGWGRIQRPHIRRRDTPGFRQRLALRTSSMFGDGTIDAHHYAEPFSRLIGSPWPSQLRVCAVDLTTGVRAVFGPWSNVDLVEACAASCAVPGLFQPVYINGVPYSDGGFYSPTNADVLTTDELLASAVDEVFVLSPMSSNMRSLPVSSDHPIRLVLHAAIALESRALRKSGAAVTVIEPNRAVRRAIGSMYLDRDRLPAVTKAALASGPPLQRPRIARRRLIPLDA